MGSWHIDKGIARKWKDAGLNEFVKNYWPDDPKKKRRFLALNDGEARPNTPFPYVVYEAFASTNEGTSSGAIPGVQQEYRSVLVQFRCHGKDTGSIGEAMSSKQVADAVAEEVAKHFGPPCRLDVFPLCNYLTRYEGDWHIREGDSETVRIIQFRYEYEGQNKLAG